MMMWSRKLSRSSSAPSRNRRVKSLSALLGVVAWVCVIPSPPRAGAERAPPPPKRAFPSPPPPDAYVGSVATVPWRDWAYAGTSLSLCVSDCVVFTWAHETPADDPVGIRPLVDGLPATWAAVGATASPADWASPKPSGEMRVCFRAPGVVSPVDVNDISHTKTRKIRVVECMPL